MLLILASACWSREWERLRQAWDFVHLPMLEQIGWHEMLWIGEWVKCRDYASRGDDHVSQCWSRECFEGDAKRMIMSLNLRSTQNVATIFLGWRLSCRGVFVSSRSKERTQWGSDYDSLDIERFDIRLPARLMSDFESHFSTNSEESGILQTIYYSNVCFVNSVWSCGIRQNLTVQSWASTLKMWRTAFGKLDTENLSLRENQGWHDFACLSGRIRLTCQFEKIERIP
jgi:hypothetical protein